MRFYSGSILEIVLLISVMVIFVVILSPLPDYIWCRKRKYKMLENRLDKIEDVVCPKSYDCKSCVLGCEFDCPVGLDCPNKRIKTKDVKHY